MLALDKLHQNLLAQQQCMVRDDLGLLAELVQEQERLWAECEASLKSAVVDGGLAERLNDLKILVEANQLLAQQSLVFARKVLSVLSDDDEYSDTGKRHLRPGKSLDIRA
jgi:hypothetical protein